MLGELVDLMESTQEVASEIAQEYPEYEAMAEAVCKEMVAMARELEAHGQREDDDHR
jgi:hypothetical protein